MIAAGLLITAMVAVAGVIAWDVHRKG